MKTDRTELVFILDRSGSVAGLEKDTIGGFNAMLDKQKDAAGKATVTTVLFNQDTEILHDRIPLDGVAPITGQDYSVGGLTALLDAVGQTILKTDNALAKTAEKHRASKVLVVITTDGMENASREFSDQLVRELIEERKGQGWEFLFLGANIDAVETAACYGIAEDRAANFHADPQGVSMNFSTVCDTISAFRSDHDIQDNWKQKIDKDFSSRKNKVREN